MKFDPIKAGATFSFYVDFAVDGVAEDFPASELASQVRDRNGSLVGALTVASVSGSPGRFVFEALPAETTAWPPGKHYCDVRRTSGGEVIFSDTVILPVEMAQTR